MKLIIYICLSVVLLSSCSMQKYCAYHYPPIIKDSTIYTENIDTCYIPVNPDTTYIHIPFNPLDSKHDTLISTETKKGKIEVVYKSELSGSLGIRITTKKDSIPTMEKTKSLRNYEIIKVPVPVVEYKIPRWAWYSLALNIFILIVVIIVWLVRLKIR